jgi:HK97 family phage portal protein
MNLRERIARLIMPPEMRGNVDILRELMSANASVMINVAQQGTQANWDYARYAAEGYAENAIVYACLGRIMQAAGSVSLGIKLKGELQTDKLLAGLVPLAKLLKRPNSTQAINEFIQMGVLHQHCGGSQHIRRIGTGTETVGGRVRAKTAPELWLLRPDRVEVQWGEFGVTGYKLDNKTQLAPEEVLTIKSAHPGSDFLGLSSLTPIRGQVDSHSAITTWNANTFKNNAVPAGILSVKGLYQKPKPERDALEAGFAEKFQGLRNAGKVMILDVDVTGFTQLASNMKELDWLNGKRDLMREVCAALNVPSILLGDPETATYANYETALRAFYRTNILPYMEHWSGEMTQWLGIQYGEDVEIVVLTGNIEVLREDENAKAQRQALRKHWTLNELRHEDGLEPVAEPDCEIPIALLKQANPFAPTAPVDQTAPRSKRSLPAQYHPRSLYPTLEQRAAAVDLAEHDRLAWTLKYQREMARYFDYQRGVVLDMVGARSKRMSGEELYLDFIRKMKADPVFREHIGSLAESMYQSFADQAAEIAGGTINILDNTHIKTKIANDIEQRSALINQTTADQLRDVLRAGLDANEGPFDIAKRIGAYFDDISGYRAEMIARTETARAQSGASVDTWRELRDDMGSPIVSSKEWISARDDAVRDTHAEADGQVVGLDEDFNVGEDAMPAPGMGGDPGENVNCRCVAAPIT